MKLYSVHDKKSGIGSPPFAAENDFIARRAFIRSATADSDLALFPDDFDLYNIGEFDLHTMKLIPETPVVFVASGVELLVRRGDDNAGK